MHAIMSGVWVCIRPILAICLSYSLFACSRGDDTLARTPSLSVRSDLAAPRLAQCIALHWKAGTRELNWAQVNDVISLHAQSYFRGIAIAERIKPAPDGSLVEFFQRRKADPLYTAMLKDCLQPSAPAANRQPGDDLQPVSSVAPVYGTTSEKNPGRHDGGNDRKDTS
ncbi:hypothetical protein SB861_47415 [Paraburkholderia sp. SIMBA_049]